MDYLNKLQKIFRDVFDDEDLKINLETDANELSDWDSLTHITLVEQIEKEFGIKFDGDQIFKIVKVDDFVKIISEKL